MQISLDRFEGIAPAVSPRLLATNFAQTAQNVEFESGALTPTETDVDAFTLSNSIRRSIFFYEDTYWLQWDDDGVTAAKSPIANDAFDRLYWTGEDYPRIGTLASMISGGTYPATSYRLGVPAPSAAPGATVVGTADTGAVPNEVSYVYTLVTAYGEEGPPSDPSTIVTVSEGQSVTVAMPGANNPSGNYNFGSGALKRIYRSNTGSQYTEYQFVAEVTYATTSYSDTTPSAFLGELLPSATWIGPPDDDTGLYPDGPLLGLIHVANGIFGGYSGKTLCLSVPYLPHAWPIDYRYTLPEPIVGIATTPGGLVALTTAAPFFVTGVDPSSMTDVRVDLAQACVNPRSIVDMGDYVLYAGPDGLCAVENGTGSLVSENIISVAQWRADFYPTTLRAFQHEGSYVAFWTDGSTHGGWVFDPKGEGGSFSTLTASANVRGGWMNPKNGILYKIVGDKIVAHRQGSGVNTLTWRSKKFVAPAPISMAWLYIDADAYPVRVKVYLDGVLLCDYTLGITGSQLTQQVNSPGTVRTINLIEPMMRVPATVGTVWEVEIEGAVVVNRIILAESAAEVRGV